MNEPFPSIHGYDPPFYLIVPKTNHHDGTNGEGEGTHIKQLKE